MEAKKNLVTHQTSQDYVIYHSGNPDSTQITFASPAQKVAYNQARFTLPSKLPLLGRANRENIQAAITAAQILKVDSPKIRKALLSFKPLEHRLELVGTYQNITFYNDSLSTTPVSTLHALEALGDQVATLIAGGFDRGLDYTQLGQVLGRSPLKTVLLFPDTGQFINQAITYAHPHHGLNLIPVKSMEMAVKLAFKHTPPGKICLLSPAAASFNLFKDYADRGDTFKRLVRSYSP